MSAAENPFRRKKEIFLAAADLPTEEQAAYLEAACAGQPELRAEMEQLLAAVGEGDFMAEPARQTVSPELEAEMARLKPEETGEKVGSYKLLQQIGEGGFGVVWMAEQEKPVRRRVALKIIKLGMDTKEVIARFEQERQALAMMDHPNIAKVLDAGTTPFGRPFFVMELVKGVKITEYCDEAQLSTAERLKLFIAVCNAVQHAHQKGIIHRDLKPSNILVTLHDGVPVPKVIDFGVAKATQQQRLTDLTLFTHFEQMIGTPLYMAPEQAELSGLDIDTRSDIYSLGVLLYELLTGRTPFDPEMLMKAGHDEMRRVIREEEPQKPSTFVSTMAVELRTNIAKHRSAEGAKLINQIRGDLDWIVMKALEKDRSRRYETASSFARDIERHLGNELVHARPPSAGYRLRRFVRRNRTLAVSAAAVVAALFLGLIGMSWQALRADREAKRANSEEIKAKTALRELRRSAPAIADQAWPLLAQERFEEAVEKLNAAISLRPDVPLYWLRKADLLQSQFQFAEAAVGYQDALRMNPKEQRASTNAILCEELAGEMRERGKLSMASLSRLVSTMKQEQRTAAEMMAAARLLGEESHLALRYWQDRLRDLPIPLEKSLDERLSLTETGLLHLDLSYTGISDLSPLKGMPLEVLDLTGCEGVVDLTALSTMPLRTLALQLTGVVNLLPLSAITTLASLNLSFTRVADLRPLHRIPLRVLSLESTDASDLGPLQGMPLEELDVLSSEVSDLSPLRGMPLRSLNIGSTKVIALEPLRGMPLKRLFAGSIPARDFPFLAELPLEVLQVNRTRIENLAFLRNLPLKELYLSGCTEARGYKVLSEVKTLERLLLPSTLADLPEEDFTAIQELRGHPSLRQIQVGILWGQQRNTLLPQKDFWKSFDADMKSLNAARNVVNGRPKMQRLGDRTWEVSFEDQPVIDLSPLKGVAISDLNLRNTNVKDLTPLKGMPLKALNLRGTNITDLSPLVGASLRSLDISGTNAVDLTPLSKMPLAHLLAGQTRVTNLMPLSALPLRELCLDGCPPEVDLSPLAPVTTLRELTLPQEAKNLDAIRMLPNLRFVSYHFDEDLKRPSQSADEFWAASGERNDRP